MWRFIWFVIIWHYAKGFRYYHQYLNCTSVSNAKAYCYNTWDEGHPRHSHLASIHSTLQLHTAISRCSELQSQGFSACWIGLEINHTNHLSFSWSDGTKYDFTALKWCNNTYPIKSSNNLSYSYGYIDIKGSCIKNTFDPEMCKSALCGPMTYQPIECWIMKNIYPGILGVVVMFPSIYFAFKVWYHLYKKEHNWITEPSKYTKFLTISFYINFACFSLFGMIFFILQGVGYKQYGIINDNYYPLDPAWPIVFQIAQYMLLPVFIILFHHLIAYFHILFRLKDYVQGLGHDITERIISCKYMLHIIGLAIVFLPVCWYFISMRNHHIENLDFKGLRIRTVIAIFATVIDLLFVNIALLYLYTKALYMVAFVRYFRESIAIRNLDTSLVDTRIH